MRRTSRKIGQNLFAPIGRRHEKKTSSDGPQLIPLWRTGPCICPRPTTGATLYLHCEWRARTRRCWTQMTRARARAAATRPSVNLGLTARRLGHVCWREKSRTSRSSKHSRRLCCHPHQLSHAGQRKTLGIRCVRPPRCRRQSGSVARALVLRWECLPVKDARLTGITQTHLRSTAAHSTLNIFIN